MPITYQQMPGMLAALQAQQGAATGFKDLAARRAAQAEAKKQRRFQGIQKGLDVFSQFRQQEQAQEFATGEREAGQEFAGTQAEKERKLERYLEGRREMLERDLSALSNRHDIELMEAGFEHDIEMLSNEGIEAVRQLRTEFDERLSLGRSMAELEQEFQQGLQEILHSYRMEEIGEQGRTQERVATIREGGEGAGEYLTDWNEAIGSMWIMVPEEALRDPEYRKQNAEALRDQFAGLLRGKNEARQKELMDGFEEFLQQEYVVPPEEEAPALGGFGGGGVGDVMVPGGGGEAFGRAIEGQSAWGGDLWRGGDGGSPQIVNMRSNMQQVSDILQTLSPGRKTRQATRDLTRVVTDLYDGKVDDPKTAERYRKLLQWLSGEVPEEAPTFVPPPRPGGP